jgi:hypothetical protein
MASTKHSLEQRTSPLPSGAKGGVAVAASTTAVAWQAVGTDGQVLTADSSATNGVSYQNISALPSGLVTLKETVFAGLTPQSLGNGTTTTLDGSGYTVTLAGNGAVDIVATGLRLRQGTTGGAGLQVVQILSGNTGSFKTFFTEERFRRNPQTWAFWSRIASYDYTNTAAGNVYGFAEMATPKWGCQIGRFRLIKGSPNTATGGLAYDWWWNGAVTNTSTYPSIGVSTNDVMCWLWRTPFYGEVYTGVYSGGWPLIGAMTKVGNISLFPGGSFITQTAADVGATNVAVNWLCGGQSATAGTYEIISDRWRVTTWG